MKNFEFTNTISHWSNIVKNVVNEFEKTYTFEEGDYVEKLEEYLNSVLRFETKIDNVETKDKETTFDIKFIDENGIDRVLCVSKLTFI